MKLAEALILRADCQKRVSQLESRLIANAKVQEGDEPGERPEELMAELENISSQLLDLIKRINKTNSTTNFNENKTLSDVLAERDVFVIRRRVLNNLAANAGARQDRYTRSEVKYITTISVAETQKRVDELARNHRELDARIQELNWQTELVD
jgi:hypothetical protein